jgi:hypothetical protein
MEPLHHQELPPHLRPLAPHLPPGWGSVAVDNVPMGPERLSFVVRRSAGAMTLAVIERETIAGVTLLACHPLRE